MGIKGSIKGTPLGGTPEEPINLWSGSQMGMRGSTKGILIRGYARGTNQPRLRGHIPIQPTEGEMVKHQMGRRGNNKGTPIRGHAGGADQSMLKGHEPLQSTEGEKVKNQMGMRGSIKDTPH